MTMNHQVNAFTTAVIAQVVELRVRVAGLEAENARLRQLAATDSLTGLPNRRAFDQAFARETAYAQRTGRAMALLLLDLDGFKRLNDTLGHSAGDTALRTVADILRGCVRASDLVGFLTNKDDEVSRVGGDEFAVILRDCSENGAGVVAERIHAALADNIANFPLPISASIGGVVCAGREPLQVYALADSFLFEAKALPPGVSRTVIRRLD